MKRATLMIAALALLSAHPHTASRRLIFSERYSRTVFDKSRSDPHRGETRKAGGVQPFRP